MIARKRIQFRLFFTLLALAILGLAIFGAYHILRRVEGQRSETIERVVSDPPKPIDPGRIGFDEAMGLIRSGNLVAARDKLLAIIHYYPNSQRIAEARRICGELNLDLLLSDQADAKKKSIEVKPGATLDGICREEKVTPEYLLRANKLTSFALQAGQGLTVRPLEFSAKVEKAAKRLILSEASSYFKEYAIKHISLPQGVSLPFEDTVKNKAIMKTPEEMLKPGEPGQDSAIKSIQMHRPNVAFRTLPPSTPPDKIPPGIYLSAEDVDELNLLLRLGSKVSFIP